MKKILSLLVIFIVSFIPLNVMADEYDDSSYYDYTLDSYDVNINVNENNTFNITETIDAFFNIEKHGIFRKIPTRNRVVRLDGTTSYNRAKISDIVVNDNFTTSNENGNKVIKIGDSDITLTGEKEYTISYLYNLGKDTGKGYDELYYNIIGDEWDTIIKNVTFTITMPKEFDKSKLGFSKGAYGTVNSSEIYYTVDGNVITGGFSGTLNPGEALTVRLELPEGYFVGASSNLSLVTILSIALPIIFLIISIVLLIKLSKSFPLVKTVEFYPPEGFNSAEVGFLYKGFADDKDVVSLLVYLANKDYIEIGEKEGKSLFKSKNFIIRKLKEYDGDNEAERIFLEGLFRTKNEVTYKDLYNKFYKTVNKITNILNDKENKYEIFQKDLLRKRYIIFLMMILTFIIITCKPVIEHLGVGPLPFALLFPGIGFSIMIFMLSDKDDVSVKIFVILWGLLFGGMPFCLMIVPSIMQDRIYVITYIIGVLCIIAMGILSKKFKKRTRYGNELLGKILGFKEFLEKVEKEKLEELVFQDPNYFYNILPFTYVLEVSDKWIKKFKDISLKAPDWYSGSSFTTATFGTFMASTMTSASKAMSSRPSSSGSSGGSSSGGGMSGGGSGGGGGGSW